MHVRAIALALPLVVGIAACQTTHSRSDRSASAATAESGQAASSAPNKSEPRPPQTNVAPAPRDPSSTGSAATSQAGQPDGNVTSSEPRSAQENTADTTPSGTSTGSAAANQAGQPHGNVTTSEPRVATEDTTKSSPSSDAGSSTSMGGSSSQGSSSSMGSSSTASSGAQDPIIEQGDPVKGHAEDNVVTGKIARVTRRQVVIESDTGAQKSLVIVPETAIQVDGQDAQRADLKEGQEVRASFSEVSGRDIAVKVRAGHDATKASPDDAEHAPTRSMNPGGSSQLDTGSGSTTGSGSSSMPSDPAGSSSTGSPSGSSRP